MKPINYVHTLGAEMFGGSDFWLETRVIILAKLEVSIPNPPTENQLHFSFQPILDIQEPLTNFHGNEAKKNFLKKKSKWQTQKKTPPILNFFVKISRIGLWVSTIN